MAKRDFKSFEQEFTQELQRLFDQTFMMRLGKMARDIIYRRTKSGYGVSTDKSQDANKQKLKELSSPYVERRKRAASGVKADLKRRVGGAEAKRRTSSRQGREKLNRASGLGAHFSPKKSNLTFSGQLLEDIEVLVSGTAVTLKIADTKRDDSDLTNAEVAQKVSDQGRPFFALTKDEQRILQKAIEQEVRSLSRRLSKRRA